MERSDTQTDGLQDEDFFLLANILSEHTGLPFVVWISTNSDAPHGVCVKVSRGPNVDESGLVTVAIRPNVHVVSGGDLSGSDMTLLRMWVELNRDVIVRCWDGDIEHTADALEALKPLS